MIDLEDSNNSYLKRKELLGYGQGQNPVVKAQGVTQAERSLQKLAERSFLSLWSYLKTILRTGIEKKEAITLV